MSLTQCGFGCVGVRACTSVAPCGDGHELGHLESIVGDRVSAYRFGDGASGLLDRQGDHQHHRLRAAGHCSLRGRRHLRRLDYGRTLRGWSSRRPPAAHRPLEGHRMFTWGVIVFVGLWLILADLGAVRKAKLMGNPILVHVVVIGSGLRIHGGSADGAMAAIVSGVFSALYVRWQQRMHGYIRKGVWYPGVLRGTDPRLGVSS